VAGQAFYINLDMHTNGQSFIRLTKNASSGTVLVNGKQELPRRAAAPDGASRLQVEPTRGALGMLGGEGMTPCVRTSAPERMAARERLRRRGVSLCLDLHHRGSRMDSGERDKARPSAPRLSKNRIFSVRPSHGLHFSHSLLPRDFLDIIEIQPFDLHAADRAALATGPSRCLLVPCALAIALPTSSFSDAAGAALVDLRTLHHHLIPPQPVPTHAYQLGIFARPSHGVRACLRHPLQAPSVREGIVTWPVLPCPALTRPDDGCRHLQRVSRLHHGPLPDRERVRRGSGWQFCAISGRSVLDVVQLPITCNALPCLPQSTLPTATSYRRRASWLFILIWTFRRGRALSNAESKINSGPSSWSSFLGMLLRFETPSPPSALCISAPLP
jgi:hypothetical protein